MKPGKVRAFLHNRKVFIGDRDTNDVYLSRRYIICIEMKPSVADVTTVTKLTQLKHMFPAWLDTVKVI